MVISYMHLYVHLYSTLSEACLTTPQFWYKFKSFHYLLKPHQQNDIIRDSFSITILFVLK